MYSIKAPINQLADIKCSRKKIHPSLLFLKKCSQTCSKYTDTNKILCTQLRLAIIKVLPIKQLANLNCSTCSTNAPFFAICFRNCQQNLNQCSRNISSFTQEMVCNRGSCYIFLEVHACLTLFVCFIG